MAFEYSKEIPRQARDDYNFLLSPFSFLLSPFSFLLSPFSFLLSPFLTPLPVSNPDPESRS
ncbi:hypothetical protein BXY64_1537 [Marinifilum flexuosum]|uniref:Uncharacterized protein n=1 Tax=Marinifilum flexuosum TaxID=1117708 RepID=A0A419X9U6_9BACT|nr:hypothetical protein BXY64_1537 [Marinifilum flexuosum]